MLEIAGNYSTPHAGNLEFEEVLEMLEIPACCKNFATLNYFSLFSRHSGFIIYHTNVKSSLEPVTLWAF